jgi:hypothetical protein
MAAAQAARRSFEKRARDDYAEALEYAREERFDADRTREELISRFVGLYYDIDENGELTHPFVRKLLGLGPLPDRPAE